jgi:hypothetical protein
MQSMFAGTQQNFDPTTVQKSNNFNGSGFAGQRTEPRNLNPYHNFEYSTRDNTAISGQLHFLVAELVKELVIVDARVEPFTNRISPFLFTPELNIVKNSRKLVRSMVPIVPHLGAFHNTRIRQETSSARQVRRGLAVEQEITSLNTPEGRRDIQDLILGASQNVLDAFIHDVVAEIVGKAEPIQTENDRRRRLATMQQNRPRDQAQKTAIKSLFHTRIRQYAIMTKERLSLDLMIQEAKKRIKSLGNTADTIVMGTDIKIRIFDTDKDRIFFFRAGPSGPLLRQKGSEEIDTYKGLGIVEIDPPHPDTGMRSLAEREVEVGEFYNLLKNPCSNGATFHPNHRRIQIYNEETDSWKMICLSDVLGPSGVFDADTGDLAQSHQDMADDYNRAPNDTQYRRDNMIANNKTIEPNQYSMFLYEDDNNLAQVANLWGQLSHEKVFKSRRVMKEMALSTLAGLGLTQTAQAGISEGLETGVRLLEQIASEPFDFNHWKRVRWTNMGRNTLDSINRNEVGRITDARGNSRGSLDYSRVAVTAIGGDTWTTNAPAATGGVGQGFGNGAGIRELAAVFAPGAGQTGENSIYGKAFAFLEAVERIVAFLQRAMGTSHALSTSAAWFHQPTAATTFIDTVFAAFELPIWMKVLNGQRDRTTGTVQVVDLAVPNGLVAGGDVTTFLNAVDTALSSTPFATYDPVSTVAVLVRLAALGRTDDGNAESALNLLQAVLANSIADITDDTGLGLLDIRFSSAMTAIVGSGVAPADDGRGSVRMATNTVATVTSLMQEGDISPAAFRNLRSDKSKKKKKSGQVELANHRMLSMRALIAWAYTNRSDVQAQIKLNSLQDRANSDELKLWFNEVKQGFRGRADAILNEAFQADTRFNGGGVIATRTAESWVRTPLTASANVVDELRRQFSLTTAAAAAAAAAGTAAAGPRVLFADAGMDVSDPRAMWDYTAGETSSFDTIANTVHGAQSNLAIGNGLLDTPVFQMLKQMQDGAAMDANTDAPRGRKRGARRNIDDDFADTYGKIGAKRNRNTPSTNSRIDAELSLFGGGGDDNNGSSRMDVEDDGAGVAGIGAQWPSRVSQSHVRDQMNVVGFGGNDGDDVEGRGMFYKRFQNRDMFKNWKSAQGLGALERSVMMVLMLTPITLDSAQNLADNTDALFGAILFRPHIRHIMTSIWIMKAGPETMFTPFSETDSRWSMDGQAKLITFTPTWQSTSFMHNRQWCIAYHDVAPVGPDAYQSGNDGRFFDMAKGIVYDMQDQSSPASIYAHLVPATFEPGAELDITGCFQVAGYDNSNPSAITPQFDGAPWFSAHWGLDRYAKKTQRTGFVDRNANTLTFRGRFNIPDGNSAHNFNNSQPNTGHWGVTKPGMKNYRNGSRIVE